MDAPSEEWKAARKAAWDEYNAWREKLKADYAPWFNPPECWEIGVENGWRGIVERLCQALKEHGVSEDFHVCQVKEKFGGLRFYYDGHIFGDRKLVSDAENESYRTCQYCGTQEGVRTVPSPHWLRSLCLKCYPLIEEEQCPPVSPSTAS